MKTLDTLFVYEKSTAHAMQAWFNACCTRENDHAETSADLWLSWRDWANEHDHYASTQRKLAMFLLFQGLQQTVVRSGTARAWKGISLSRRQEVGGDK